MLVDQQFHFLKLYFKNYSLEYLNCFLIYDFINSYHGFVNHDCWNLRTICQILSLNEFWNHPSYYDFLHWLDFLFINFKLLLINLQLMLINSKLIDFFYRFMANLLAIFYLYQMRYFASFFSNFQLIIYYQCLELRIHLRHLKVINKVLHDLQSLYFYLDCIEQIFNLFLF